MSDYLPASIAALSAFVVYLAVYIRSVRAKRKRQADAMLGGYRPR